jgi:hypothetical protein
VIARAATVADAGAIAAIYNQGIADGIATAGTASTSGTPGSTAAGATW